VSPQDHIVHHNGAVARTFSYADAVKLLGAKQSGVLATLNRIVGGVLFSGATMGLSDLLGWFDAKEDFVRTSHELLVKAGERRSGLSRYDQTERTEAAHAVGVVVAFFEAIDELDLPITWADLDLDRARQLSIVGLTTLFNGELPLPSPSRPYERIVENLTTRYGAAADEFGKLVRSSAVWDRMSENERDRLRANLAVVVERAVRRYEELLRKLGGGYPELRFWFQVQDGVATRVALAELEESLRDLLVGGSPDERREELARKYQALLERPVVEQEEVLPGLRVPQMGRIYVDPDFQVVPYAVGCEPAALTWWQAHPVRHDLYRYLTGYLTSPQAVRAPLLVLGDPGSGKSMLTKVLAARLPASDFLTVRVELRGTPAEGDLVDQIQHGLRAALHEDISWAELDRSSGDALPVVLLDGFDELLQATGVNQTRYLTKVQQFQHDRAETGHPVAVVVTSRMSVCGGVHIPPGSDVLRLRPFTEVHVRQWLDSWNFANADYFRESGLMPLTAEVALRYPDLATQPLLLLMLALYDAAGNALQPMQGSIGGGELYERLLTKFAGREVAKDEEERADLVDDVETELERLSVVAFAMFNRGAQWVTESELTKDMVGLLGMPGPDGRSGMRSPLTAGEAVLGRFFFVQRSEAMRDEHTLRTYEFLHATFGEYLVARFTWRVLADLLAAERNRPRRHASTPLDDTELFALLSFSPLSVRDPVLTFLREFMNGTDNRADLVDLVRLLFTPAQAGAHRSDTAYQPVARGMPARYAIYGLNLVTLGVLLSVTMTSKNFGIEDWPRLAAFWRSQLTTSEWQSVKRAFGAKWDEGGTVELSSDEFVFAGPVESTLVGIAAIDPGDVLSDAQFTADPHLNYLRWAIDPALREESINFARMMVDLGITPPSDRAERDGWYKAAAYYAPDIAVEQVGSDKGVEPVILSELAATPVGIRVAFWGQLYERIGKGGPDHALLAIIDEYWPRMNGLMCRAGLSMLDAWLRLQEIGHKFSENRYYFHLPWLIAHLDLRSIHVDRPDLVVRLKLRGLDLTDMRRNSPAKKVQQSAENRLVRRARVVSRENHLAEIDNLLAHGMISGDEHRDRMDAIISR
jgi:hypothetical protein